MGKCFCSTGRPPSFKKKKRNEKERKKEKREKRKKEKGKKRKRGEKREKGKNRKKGCDAHLRDTHGEVFLLDQEKSKVF
jgi:hypothetical protein